MADGTCLSRRPTARRAPDEEAERNLPRGETYLSATPAVSQTNSKSRRLSQRRGSDRGQSRRRVAACDAAAPPRRPEELTTASIPWPPLRPVQLATVISAPVPRVAAYAADMSLDRGAAIRSLIEATQGAREPRGAALPTVITSGASKPEKASSQAMALAYAPAGGATTGLRAVALGQPYLSQAAVGHADFVAARLDRSNFRALTGHKSVARMTTHSVLGSAAMAPRAASRAEPICSPPHQPRVT